jgi:predicted dehydrogenase
MSELRIGVIGVGHLGKEHARIVSGLAGVQLAGVADVNAAQAQAVAQRCGTDAFADFRLLLERIDAAVIAVPTIHHHAVAADLLRFGIPALVEKPFASTHGQAEELLALSKKHGAMIQVGHIERFNPAFEALQGRPLTPKYISSERLGGYTGRSTDVGVVLDLMIHDIDLILALVASPITQVQSLGVSVLGGPEDMAIARVVFANGCVADLRASRLAAAPSRQMQVWGPEGFACIDFARKHLSLMQPSPSLCRHRSGEQPFDKATMATLKDALFGRHLQTMDIATDGCDQLTMELMDFVRCVRTGARPRAGGEEGCAALNLAEEIIKEIAQHPWDAAGLQVGPNAFDVPRVQLFQPAQPGVAA